jgi:hypothetical protein
MRDFSYYASRLNQYVDRILYTGIFQRTDRQSEILTDVYHTVNQFLSKLDVRYCITYGTLLGWHRENGLIPGDRDVDFALVESDYEKIWRAREDLPGGYRMYDTSRYHRGPKLYISHKGFDADLYFFRVTGNTMQTLEITATSQYMQPFPADFIFPLRQADFLGSATFIPNFALDFLRHTYGYLGRNGVRDLVTGLWSESARELQDNQ